MTTTRPKPKPQQLAVRYLNERWQKKHGTALLPMDMVEAVTYAVLQLGYTKAVVDRIMDGWEKNRVPTKSSFVTAQ